MTNSLIGSEENTEESHTRERSPPLPRINQVTVQHIRRNLRVQLTLKTSNGVAGPDRRVLRCAPRSAQSLSETIMMTNAARGLTIVDTFFRFSPGLVPRFTLRGADVVRPYVGAFHAQSYYRTLVGRRP
jgi:hypothetical protein